MVVMGFVMVIDRGSGGDADGGDGVEEDGGGEVTRVIAKIVTGVVTGGR